MAKKDKKAKAAAGGAKTVKLPKQVAGVKIPKELRKSGRALLEAANSPVGRQVIAAGVTALIAAAAARNQPVRAAAAEVADDTAKAAEAGMTQAGEIVDAIAGVAGAALQRMFEKKAG